MRMWNVDPKFMCDKHLLGEHLEMHMIRGCLEKDIDITGYINKGLVDISHIEDRHNALALEMLERGMNHRSPIYIDEQLLYNYTPLPVDVKENLKELSRRCLRCRRKIKKGVIQWK